MKQHIPTKLVIILALIMGGMFHLYAQPSAVTVKYLNGSTWSDINGVDLTIDDSLTIEFDVSKGTQDLEGVSKIYLHSALVLDGPEGTSWSFRQGDWNIDSTRWELEQIGSSSIWRKRIKPSNYYSQVAGDLDYEEVHRISMTFRSEQLSGGPIKGADDCSYSNYFIDFVTPVDIEFDDLKYGAYHVAGDTNLTIAGSSTKAANIDLYVKENGTYVKKHDISKSCQIVYTTMFDAPGTYDVMLVATDLNTSSVKDTATAQIFVHDVSEMDSKPANIISGVNYFPSDPTKATLCLYAPKKDFVLLDGEFYNWQPRPMKKDANGYFWLQVDNLVPGRQYAYQYLVDGHLRLSDPYSELILDPKYDPELIDDGVYPLNKQWTDETIGVVSILQTDQPDYEWQTTSFSPPVNSNLLIYELWVRNFGEKGIFQEVIDSLDYIKSLGINAIELMPVNEFGYNDSWGYNPTHYFAVDKRYGLKNDLKKLIDSAHAKGMAVIIDMVLNHSGTQSPMIQMYYDQAAKRPTIDNPWFNQYIPACGQSVWGPDFDHTTTATQDFVDSVNTFWLSEFKVDGMRFDFTKGFTNRFDGDCGYYDPERIAVIERMADEMWEVNDKAYVILEHWAESEENDLCSHASPTVSYNKILTWNDHLEERFYDQISANKPAALDDAKEKKSVSFLENHDEERMIINIMKGGLESGDYNLSDTSTALQRMAMGSAFFYLMPGPKMLWMFSELGFDYSINYNGRTGTKPTIQELGYMNDPRRQELKKITSALLKLRDTEPFKDASDDIDVWFEYPGLVKGAFYNDPNGSNAYVLGNFDVVPQTFVPQRYGTWYNYFTGEQITLVENEQITMGPGEWMVLTEDDRSIPEGFEDKPTVTLAGTNSSLSFTLGVNGQVNLADSISPFVGQSYKWTSSNSTDVSVSSNGVVTALNTTSSPVTITAEVFGNSNKTATCQVTVDGSTTSLDSLVISRKSLNNFRVGNDYELYATRWPATSTNGNTIAWGTTDANVVSVSNGDIHAEGAGSARVYCKVSIGGGNYKTDTCFINVIQSVSSISLAHGSMGAAALEVGETDTLVVTFNPTGTSNQGISWSSSNSSAVLICDGVAIAKAGGKSSIQAQSADNGDVKAWLDVMVEKAPDQPAGLLAGGLDYKYYDLSSGDLQGMPLFGNYVPDMTDSVDIVKLEDEHVSGDNFACLLTGYFKAPTDGEYIFYVKADDKAVLYIGNSKVVEDSYDPGENSSQDTMYLKAGYHAMEIRYLENTGNTDLELKVKKDDYNGGNVTIVPDTLLFRELPLREPDNPDNLLSGLDCYYYEVVTESVPDFSTLTAEDTVIRTQYRSYAPPGENDDFYALKYTGFVEIPEDGIYKFYLNSDDGSNLYIGSEWVVDNDGKHGEKEESGEIGLKAGMHAIRVEYFEYDGGRLLTVSYESEANNIDKKEIPASMLFREDTTTSISITNGSSISMKNGQIEQLSISFNPTTASDRNIIWESDDDDVVTVDWSGKITGTGEGSATVTAKLKSDPSIQASITVNTTVIHIGGSFNGWVLDPMTSVGQDGDLYVSVLTLDADSYTMKFSDKTIWWGDSGTPGELSSDPGADNLSFTTDYSGAYTFTFDMTTSPYTYSIDCQDCPESGSTYYIRAKTNNAAVEADSVNGNGSVVFAGAYDGYNPYQQWILTEVTTDTFSIVSATNTNKALDVEGVSTQAGAKIHQWNYGGYDNQLWKLVDRDQGYFQIKSVNGGNMIDIDALDSIIQNTDDVNSQTQLWFFELYETNPGSRQAGEEAAPEIEPVPSEISLYPNPAYDFINVKNGVIGSKVFIYDLMGRQVMNFELTESEAQIEVRHLEPGLYNVLIIHDNQFTYKKQLIR
ncbi:PA14 domain-containing protein [Marinoscillum sp. MHG1-6]|uniref:PA14 domain-containing protein n=1 Tax=Marinoscillum sp. MHG1-6 TaxID=2959627 RepID=UPI0021586F28|nr:PA14 domain-containing protein [Marinoscillum sp. MHG1-6]